jgi:hypothetical protein
VAEVLNKEKVVRKQTDLLNLRKVILRVLVEYEFSDGTKWELAMWPDLCEIEDVVAEFFCLLRGHGLL